jgi:hypothetical protein
VCGDHRRSGQVRPGVAGSQRGDYAGKWTRDAFAVHAGEEFPMPAVERRELWDGEVEGMMQWLVCWRTGELDSLRISFPGSRTCGMQSLREHRSAMRIIRRRHRTPGTLPSYPLSPGSCHAS